MKKFRVLLALVLAVAVMGGSLVTVFAEGFKDVDETAYSWCIAEIEEMAEEGIISGYSDGTFKPQNTVTKLEALALVARVLGSRDEVNALLLESAKEIYGEKVEEYDLSFGIDEVCFLLFKGIIFEDELEDYLGSANEGMKRYEVAILLTKAMGAEAAVKEKVAAVLDYSDTMQIPSNARKYVEYVTAEGLMQGVGDNTFAPVDDVNRAQAALLLYRLKDLTDYTTFSGIVASYDKDSRTIRIKIDSETNKAYTVLPDSVTLRCDGEAISPDDITVGWEAVVTTQNDMLAIVDFLSTQSEGMVAGKLLSVIRNAGEVSLKVEKTTALDKETVTYKVSDDVVVTYNGKSGSVAKLTTGDYVKLTINKNKVTVIDGETSTKTVNGTITAIDLENGVNFKVMVNGYEESYFAASNVKVARNNSSSKLSELLVGDKVKLKLEYDIITSIDATSTNTSDTGIIVGVNISNTPTLEIKIGSNVAEYPIARDAQIMLDGRAGTIYDLRLNSNATITLESDSIVKIVTTPVEDITEVKGEVVGVNVSYDLIQVKYIDPVSSTENVEQVFVKSGAKIISISSSADKKLKDVQVGQTVTAMGSRATGVFEATTVVIMN